MKRKISLTLPQTNFKDINTDSEKANTTSITRSGRYTQIREIPRLPTALLSTICNLRSTIRHKAKHTQLLTVRNPRHSDTKTRRKRDIHTETDPHTDTHSESHTESKKERDRQTHPQTRTNRHTETETKTDTYKIQTHTSTHLHTH